MVLPSSGPRSPWVTAVVILAAVLLAAASVVLGLQERRLTCTPAACATVNTYPSSRAELSLANIRGVEIHEGSGKQRGKWRLSLIDAGGASIPLYSTDQAGAEALKRELEEVLAGKREAVEHVTPPKYWMLLFAPLLLIFAISELRAAIRNRGRYARTAKPSPPGAMKRPLLLWLGLVAVAIVVSVIGNLVMSAQMAASTGVLQLECHHRCEFSGATCLPGGSMEMSLNPGEYAVKVWNPAVAGSWEPRSVRVEIGAQTRFVCEPGD
jgi:hypothetical protein